MARHLCAVGAIAAATVLLLSGCTGPSGASDPAATTQAAAEPASWCESVALLREGTGSGNVDFAVDSSMSHDEIARREAAASEALRREVTAAQGALDPFVALAPAEARPAAEVVAQDLDRYFTAVEAVAGDPVGVVTAMAAHRPSPEYATAAAAVDAAAVPRCGAGLGALVPGAVPPASGRPSPYPTPPTPPPPPTRR